MFKGSRLLRTQHWLNGSDMFVVKEVTMPTSVPNPHTHPPEIAVSTPAPTHGANSVPIAAKQNYKCGRVNHVTMEEAQEAQDVVIDMFLSMTLLQLCYLILEHHILSYLLHMLGNIICP
jgi:hypothetical protein